MPYPRTAEQSIRWRIGRNKSGEIIPPFACCALGPLESETAGLPGGLKGTLVQDDAGGQRVLDLYKPGRFHADWQDAALLCFNGPQAIQADDGTTDGHNRGRVTTDFPAYAVLELDVADPGDDLGPVENKWYLTRRQRGAFRLLGQDPVLRCAQDDTSADPLGLGLVVPAVVQRVDSPDIVMLKNLDSSRQAGEVLQLGALLDVVIDPRRLRFEGLALEEHPRQVAVLLDDCEADHDVPARVSGVCAAQVNVTDFLHRRAYPQKGSSVLQSGWAGPAEILRMPDSGGSQMCAVRLYTPNTVSYWGVTTSEITAASYATNDITPGSGTVVLFESNQYGHLVPVSGSPVATVRNYAPDTIDSGLLVRLASDDDWQLAIVNQFCNNGFDA